MNTTVVIILSLVVYHIHLASQVGQNFCKTYTFWLLIIPTFLIYFGHKLVQVENKQTQTKVRLHIHHVHLFYLLAFFTRFPDLLSRIAAGLAIGSSLHGAAAYGYDTTFEKHHEPYEI